MLAIGAVPLFLLIAPGFYYSMDTPIGLFERSPEDVHRYDSIGRFLSTLKHTITETDPRFRPFLDYWNALHWKLFGELAWPFQLSRWLFHFGAFALFVAGFMRVVNSGSRPASTTGAGLLLIMPMSVLGYLWLPHPNVCLVRIECVETFTIFFLGLCNWAAALMLTAQRSEPRARYHVLFLLGFLGLVLSKEPNLAPALWLLLCYCAWVIRNHARRNVHLIAAAAMALVLGFAIYKVNKSLVHSAELGAYYTQSLPDRFADNAMGLLRGVFQWETSQAIASAYAFLLLALIVALAARLAKRRIDREFMFIILLLGEFSAVFLVLSYQYGMTLRYWSILVPILATLLAFSARFILDATKGRRLLTNGMVAALTAFIVFYMSANYYNFLYQIIGHHSARNLDELVIREVAKLLRADHYVMAHEHDWAYEQTGSLNSHWNWHKHWPHSSWRDQGIHRLPPKDPARPMYILDVMGIPGLVSMETHAAWSARSEYGILDLPWKMSAFVQGREIPHVRLDAGMNHLGDYRAAIHYAPRGLEGHFESLLAAIGDPIDRSVFDVHLADNRITYVKRLCSDNDMKDRFLLHFVAERASFLPPDKRRWGFDNQDFWFHDYGIRNDGVCLAQRVLPQYPVTGISTGQYWTSGGRIWEVRHRVQLGEVISGKV